MLTEIPVNDRIQYQSLFYGHLGGFIPDSILQGHMGRMVADQADKTFAALELPEVKLTILGGHEESASTRTNIRQLKRNSPLIIASPIMRDFVYKFHAGKCVALERFAFSADSLRLAHLQGLKEKTPAGFQVAKIDVPLAEALKMPKNKFAKEHGINFESAEDFVNRGVGFCALQGDQVACVASCFTVCDGAIEIQIDTARKFQGKGVATAVAAHLITHCLENDIIPGWDAATEISAKFAEKLGYTKTGAYEMVVYTGSRLLVSLRKTIRWVLGKDQ